MKPVMNGSSEKILLATVHYLPQSLLIFGPDGVGLSTIAKYIAELCNIKPLIILPEKDEKINIEKGVISVDIIRKLYEDLRTKVFQDRIIIIDYAERMTIQSQNSFLKLLEEPGINIHFILVSHSTTKLLPTILSRMEKLEIKPISLKQSEKLLDNLNLINKTKRSQILFIANGLPAEITRLSTNDEYFNNRSLIIRDARDLLRGNLYQKLLITHKYKDNRVDTLILLNDVLKIIKISISEKPNYETIKYIDSILYAYQQIEANGNIRLCLSRMIM